MVRCKQMKNYLLVFKVLRQLGWRQGFLYAWYQFLLHSGILRFLTPTNINTANSSLSPLPIKLDSNKFKNILKEEEDQLIKEADQIVKGQIKLFGALDQTLDFSQPEKIKHWTQHKNVWVKNKDIKLYWEAARFGWAISLARAYALNKDERYAEAFWSKTQEFLNNNPSNHGLHWSSAQEVAIRLISLSFCYGIFVESKHSTESRKILLSKAIAAHAERIPPTMIYARAQNNNHLITEAMGLYTASAILPQHPKAKKWHALGWKWLNNAFQTQIMQEGRYIQNSNNYHRLMLQCALWVKMISEIHSDTFPTNTTKALAAATKFLYDSLDKTSGQAPNLGPNDGAYILPLTILPFQDYRPVLQAAGRAFLGHSLFPSGSWDEMSAWLVKEPFEAEEHTGNSNLRLSSINSWASLRAVKHQHRPGHADQLHIELWWHGLNIARDAGTYLYNAPPPWQNALSGTDVHNTISLNDQDQMLKTSRFLYLDWAQATVLEKNKSRITAEHDGYRKQGLTHHRSLEVIDKDQWQINDIITSNRKETFTARLHWLLPDWPWRIEKHFLYLESPHGWITLQINSKEPLDISLVRAGELLYGQDKFPPYRGWVSPTYAIKNPALSFAVRIKAQSQLNLASIWQFPKTK